MSNILDQKGVGQLSIFVIKKSLFQEQMYDIIQLELLHIVFRQWMQWTVALCRGWLYGYLWCTYLYVYIRYASSCHFRPNQWQKVAYSPFGHKTTPSAPRKCWRGNFLKQYLSGCRHATTLFYIYILSSKKLFVNNDLGETIRNLVVILFLHF